MARFVVRWFSDAVADGWVDEGEVTDGFLDGGALFDTAQSPPTLVGEDGGEPEDQTLWRDWSWVAEALNAVAGEADAIRAAASAEPLRRLADGSARQVDREARAALRELLQACGVEVGE